MADFQLSVDHSLEEAVAFAEASPYPAPEQALEDVFAA
jgi:TPP-dependent pyruvate/acetoin dehydrogenase alpha subunit